MESKKSFRVNNLSIYLTSLCNKSYILEQNNINYPVKPDVDYSKVPVDGIYIPKKSNEVYEFRGDSVISSIIVNYICDRYGDYTNEEFLTNLKIKLIRTSMLYRFSITVGLDKYILISSHLEGLEEKGQSRNSEKLNENTFEAFIGAMTIDHPDDGYNMAKDFIIGIIERSVDLGEIIRIDINPKQKLSKKLKDTGVNIETCFFQTGPANNRRFYCYNLIDRSDISQDNLESIIKCDSIFRSKNTIENIPQDSRLVIGYGISNKKTDAEQTAAKVTLIHLHTKSNNK